MVTPILARGCAPVPRTFVDVELGIVASVAPAPENFGGFECLVHDCDGVLMHVQYFDTESAADRYAQFAVQS